MCRFTHILRTVQPLYSKVIRLVCDSTADLWSAVSRKSSGDIRTLPIPLYRSHRRAVPFAFPTYT